MFKQSFGSPRMFDQQQEEGMSILSPRNFLKMISNSIDHFRINNLHSPNQANYQQFVETFQPYLSVIREQYRKYEQNKCRKQSNNTKNQMLQLQIKINRIPSAFFIEPSQFKLQICKRNEYVRKQQQLTQYLDQIQVVLFTKVGKYPQKSHIILQTMNELEKDVNVSIENVINFRKQLKQKLIKNAQKQIRVRKINTKIQNIKNIIKNIHLMKKMRDLKMFSMSDFDNKEPIDQQVLLKIKQHDLNICSRLVSMKKELQNIEKYRKNVKDKLYKQFTAEIGEIFNRLLKYNKQDWKNIHVPSSIFVGQTNQGNVSSNNITILDQSYFAFDCNPINIVKTKKDYRTEAIAQQGEQENQETLDLNKIYKLWTIIKQFDLYDQSELNDSLSKVLVKHHTAFNQDMHDYANYLYNATIKQKSTTILKSGTLTYASLKNRQNISKEGQVNQNESHQQRLSSIDMKLFIKIVKFYFQLIKRILALINGNKQLLFLQSFKQKYCQFLQDRISYFVQMKAITHELCIDDFISYLSIINYWENEEFYEIEQFCQKLRNSKTEEYLTNIQKNLLIKQIKQNIEQSNYLPVNLSSDHYMTFHYLLAPKSPFQDDQMNMSITICQQQQQPCEQAMVLRLINKNIFYKNKIYKICDSFLELIKSVEKYNKLKQHLYGFEKNIEEKICEIIGFYAWYNQKNLNNNKNGAKTLKNYCTFFSTLLFLKQLFSSLDITNKKNEKTRLQLSQCEKQISKTITMTPFMMVEDKISNMYQSKIATKIQIPTPETQRIIQIIKISTECLKQYFPIEYEQKLNESYVVKFLQTTIKLVFKNYFGYLVNMQKRGLTEIRWFLPKLKQIFEQTIINNSDKIIDKKGELVCKNGNHTFYFFNQEIQEMEKILRQKSIGK